MISEIAKILLGFLKLTPRYLIALVAIACILLFGPDDLLHKIGVYQVVQDYRFCFGLTFVAALVLVLVILAVNAINSLKKWRRIIQRLQRLTEEEKQILRYYIGQQTRSSYLRIDDGVVNGLVAAAIISPAAQIGSLVGGVAHNITDIAWDYLNRFPDLLKGDTNTYRTDKRDSGRW